MAKNHIPYSDCSANGVLKINKYSYHICFVLTIHVPFLWMEISIDIITECRIHTSIFYHIQSVNKQSKLQFKKANNEMSHIMRKPTMWFPNMWDAYLAVQAQKIARGWKLKIKKEVELYYPWSENKGADQLCSYCKAALCHCFRICKLLVFS